MLAHEEFLRMDVHTLIDPKRAATRLPTITEVVNVRPIADPNVLETIGIKTATSTLEYGLGQGQHFGPKTEASM